MTPYSLRAFQGYQDHGGEGEGELCHDLGDLNATNKKIAFHNRWTSVACAIAPSLFLVLI